jgi:hypothetical protein
MKTRTYLRLSLLLPFLVWGVCVLFFILLSAVAPDGPENSGAVTLVGLLLLGTLFYVFGIVGWFLPYALLSLLLLSWSFRGRAEVLLKAFALSPFAMAMLIVFVVNMLSIGTGSRDLFSYNPADDFENFPGSNLWFAILTLIWGYICVGIGYGLYKLLQRLGFIKDEGNAEPVSLIQVQS